MKEEHYLILRINADHRLEEACVCLKQTEPQVFSQIVEQKTIHEALAFFEKHAFKVVVCVPTQYTIFFQHSLPSVMGGAPEKTLLYELSDRFLDPINALHLIITHTQASSGEYEGIVVAKNHMEQWIEACKHQKLLPHAFIPEVLALPYQATTSDQPSLSYARIPEGYLVRSGYFQGFFMPENIAETMQALEEKGTSLDLEQIASLSLLEKAKNILGQEIKKINLLQGDFYFYDETQTIDKQRAKKLILLCLIPFLCLFSIPFYLQDALIKEKNLWTQKQETLIGYLSQTQSKSMALSQARQRNQGQNILEQFLAIGSSLEKNKGIIIQQIDYHNDNQKMIIRLSAPDFNHLDQWRKSLEQEHLRVIQNWSHSKKEGPSEAEFTIHSR